MELVDLERADVVQSQLTIFCQQGTTNCCIRHLIPQSPEGPFYPRGELPLMLDLYYTMFLHDSLFKSATRDDGSEETARFK
jgi:hypothetical protein